MYSKWSIKDIKTYVESLQKDEYILAINQLREDNRDGVKKLTESLQKKLDAIAKEEARLAKMISFDKNFEHDVVAGIDEVGRGPLAGPVVAACVVMKKDSAIPFVNDSKKLSEKKREDICEQILKEALYCGIGIADNEEIDNINILNATFLAMERAINELGTIPEFILIDGNQMLKNVNIKQQTVIKGDSKSYAIACASIVAKVYRDNLMKEYHELYPNYDFLSNKGYGTANHYKGIEECGITPIHRKSFLSSVL